MWSGKRDIWTFDNVHCRCKAEQKHNGKCHWLLQNFVYLLRNLYYWPKHHIWNMLDMCEVYSFILSTVVLGWSRIRWSQGQSWASWCWGQRWQGTYTPEETVCWYCLIYSDTELALWLLYFFYAFMKLRYSKNLFSGQSRAAWDCRSSWCSWFRTSRRKGKLKLEGRRFLLLSLPASQISLEKNVQKVTDSHLLTLFDL